MDTRQYLYCLKPKPEYAEKAGVIKGVTVIGKLDIVWKTNLGERGRLQTSQLQRMVSCGLARSVDTHSPGSPGESEHTMEPPGTVIGERERGRDIRGGGTSEGAVLVAVTCFGYLLCHIFSQIVISNLTLLS